MTDFDSDTEAYFEARTRLIAATHEMRKASGDEAAALLETCQALAQ